MNKEYYTDIIEKIARSDDAKRKKQYRQMLKRLYGGNDEMINAISESKDPNIYHGTKGEFKGDILREGFLADKNKTGQYGKGTYLGDKRTAMMYAGDIGSSSEEAKKNLLRLKRPSELKGTKTMYGNQSNFKTITEDKVKDDVMKVIGKPGDISDVKHSSSRYYEKLLNSNMSNDEVANHITSKVNNRLKGTMSEIDPEDIDLLKAHVNNSRAKGKSRAPYQLNDLFKDRSEARASNRANKILNDKSKVEKVMAYGNIDGQRAIRTPQYNGKHLIATKDIDKNLIVDNMNPKGLSRIEQGRAVKVKRKPTLNNFGQNLPSVINNNSGLPVTVNNFKPKAEKVNNIKETIEDTVRSTPKPKINNSSSIASSVNPKSLSPKVFGALGAVGTAGALGYGAYKLNQSRKNKQEQY